MVKRILFFISVCLLIGNFSIAQYWYLPQLTQQQNPNGLNSSDELPLSGTSGGWTTVLSPGQTTPAWSATQTIPFTFNFNGSVVSQYKVSSTGILTFDLGATELPTADNAALPSDSIPENSIVIWGIEGIGTNDRIVQQTFGSAPDRQYWVHFSSYTLGDTSSYWSYWAIVLEEKTDKIYIVDQRQKSSITKTVTAGIQINDSLAFSVSGSPNLSVLSGSTTGPNDNIYYEFMYGSQSANDLRARKATMPGYANINDTLLVSGVIANYGTETIISFDINWNSNNGTIHTESFTGVSIATNTDYSFTHTDKWSAIASGNYTIDLWVSNPNGTTDENHSNDSTSASISVMNDLITRKSLYEVFTSSTCAPCVAGNANLEDLFGILPNIGPNPNSWTMVKYQMNFPGNGDPYYTDEAGARANYYGVTGIPRLEINGAWNSNPGGLSQPTIDTYNTPAFLDIGAEFTIEGNTIDVEATFTSTKDTLGLTDPSLVYHIAIMEHETNQNTGTNGETYFNYVMKKMVPDSSGTPIGPFSANIPVSVNHSYTFQGSYILPPDGNSPINHNTEHTIEDFEDLVVVVWVQDTLTKEVHQSAWAMNNTPVSIKESTDYQFLRFYPNPIFEKLTIEVKTPCQISLYNSNGQMIIQKTISRISTFDISTLPIGFYFLKATDQRGKLYTKKLIKGH